MPLEPLNLQRDDDMAPVTHTECSSAASKAIPTLEKLTDHADPQIAERAKAALRQVRGR